MNILGVASSDSYRMTTALLEPVNGSATRISLVFILAPIKRCLLSASLVQILHCVQNDKREYRFSLYLKSQRQPLSAVRNYLPQKLMSFQ
jgi:hypothetical protein